MITKSKAVHIFAYMIIGFMVFMCIFPLLILVSSSFSSEQALVKFGYSVIPRGFNLSTYQYLWGAREGVLQAYKMSFLITLVGVVGNLTLTILYAYPLSRRNLPGNRIISFFLFFTMLFNGGLVPTYMVYTRIFDIKDTFLALIIPSLLMNAFNIIVMRTYISSNVPDEILDAAKIDGANEFQCLGYVVIPTIKPIMATIGLLNMISYWNNWTNGMYYIQTEKELLGVQNFMMTVINSVTALKYQQTQGINVDYTQIPTTGVRMALAVIAVVPILLVYPFFQKSFVKGLTIGSVKG